MKVDSALDTFLCNLIENLGLLSGFKRLDLTFGWLCSTISKLAGYKNPENICGLTDYDIKADAVKFADTFRSQDQFVLRQQSPYRGLDILRYADGEIHVLQVKKSLVLDNDKKPYGVLGQADHVSNDILQKLTRYVLAADKHFLAKNLGMQSYQLMENNPFVESEIKFTKRQVECFFYIIRGYSATEIANILHVSKRTIENHIQAIKVKLGCNKKSELIDNIISLGYLNVIPASFFNAL
jgi:DNA-binding CsgD family transcriptional regulator